MESPKIGGFIKLGLVVAPILSVVDLLGWESYLILKVSVVGALWLLNLEKILHIRMYFTVIPWLWIFYAGIVLGILSP